MAIRTVGAWTLATLTPLHTALYVLMDRLMAVEDPRTFPLKLIKFSALIILVLFLANQFVVYFVSGCTDVALSWYDCKFLNNDVSFEMAIFTLLSGMIFFISFSMLIISSISYFVAGHMAKRERG